MKNGITSIENLELLIKKAREDGFDNTAEVFINVKGNLSITFADRKFGGYRGYFLDFLEDKITYSD